MTVNCRRLENKNAIVLGGGSGIGKAGAIRMAREGANIVIGDIVKERVESAVAEVQKSGGKSVGFVVDSSIPDEVIKFSNDAISAMEHIDILVYSAGVGDKNDTIMDQTLKKWQWVFDVNLTGMFLSSQIIGKHMVEKGIRGKIITFASTMGKSPQGGGGGAYVSSKAAVIGFTKALACELAINEINVNCICPGLIDTPIWHSGDKSVDMPEGSMVKMVAEQSMMSGQLPIQRVGKPEDVAAGLAFLASSDSDYITGQAINICGGIDFH